MPIEEMIAFLTEYAANNPAALVVGVVDNKPRKLYALGEVTVSFASADDIVAAALIFDDV